MLTPSADQVLAAADRLHAAQVDGRLDALCDEHGVEVLTLHGSVARDEPDPHDLDLAVRFRTDDGDLVALVTALGDLVGLDVDLMDLRRAGVTGRARGLAHGAVPLYESRAGAFAEAQIAALSLAMDFAPLRREQLRLLAGR